MKYIAIICKLPFFSIGFCVAFFHGIFLPFFIVHSQSVWVHRVMVAIPNLVGDESDLGLIIYDSL